MLVKLDDILIGVKTFLELRVQEIDYVIVATPGKVLIKIEKSWPEDDTAVYLPSLAIDLSGYRRESISMGEVDHVVTFGIGIYPRNDLEKHRLFGQLSTWFDTMKVDFVMDEQSYKAKAREINASKSVEGQLIYQRTRGDIIFDLSFRESE